MQGCRDHTTKEQGNMVQYSGNAGIATCSKPLDAATRCLNTCSEEVSQVLVKYSKNYSADTGEERKKRKINFHPGIKPGTQRLGVQYTRHQAITQDKSLSPLYFPFFPSSLVSAE